MKKILSLQKLSMDYSSGNGGNSDGASNLSLLASCANSTISLLTCH
jgi:hypothetical protein